MRSRTFLALWIIIAGSAFAAVPERPRTQGAETTQPLAQSFAEYLRTHRSLLDISKPAYENGVVLVKVKPQVGQVIEGAVTFGVKHADAVLHEVGAYRISHAFGPSPRASGAAPGGTGNELERIYAVNYVSTLDPVEVAERIALDPGVEYAEPSPIRYFDCTANDFNAGDITQYQLERCRVIDAWRFPTVCDGSAVVIMAIVDSGVDIGHEDLKGLLWTNPDANNDGYTNDFNGVDLVGDVSDAQAQNGYFRPDGDPSPGAEHGTHVAGDANAECNNGVGMCGTGYNMPLMSIKCGTNNPNGSAVYRGYEGIRWAADHGAGVINCSWGGPGISQAEQDVVNYAVRTKNAVVVVAAGNSSNNNDVNAFGPASLTNVVSVGATGLSGNTDAVAGFSDYGFSVKTWAPGVDIYSCLPRNQSGERYGKMSGTSMASPVAAGIAGLLRKVYPSYSAEQIGEQMHVHSRLPLDKANRKWYYGLLDAYECGDNDSLPGCVVYATQATATSDTVPLQITLKNLLHTTDNLRATLSLMNTSGQMVSSAGNLTLLSANAQYYGSILTGQTATKSFNVRLAPGVSRAVAKFVLFLQDGNAYTDYLLFTATVTHTGVISWNVNTIADSLLYSVHGIDDNMAWAAGGGTSTQVGVVYNTLDGTSWNEVVSPGGSGPESKETFYCIEAQIGADRTQRVWLGSSTRGTHKAHVFYSTYSDATGFSWNPVDVSAITPFVNSIHFFNTAQGVMLGDPANGKWGIATTIDGGRTWTPIAASVPAVTDTGWNNAADWVDGNGWFGSSTNHIYRTSDSGQTWTAFVTPFSSPQGIAFKDARTGLAFFNAPGGGGGARMARTVDGGTTWSPITGPGTNARYSGIAYVKKSNTVWITGTNNPGTSSMSDFVYMSTNNGGTWTLQSFPAPPSPALSWAPSHIGLGMGVKDANNKAGLSGWVVGAAIIDYNQLFTVGVHDAQAGVISATSLQSYPNPFSSRTVLRATLDGTRRVTSLVVFNTLGAQVADLTSEARRGDGVEIAAVFDAAGLNDGMYYATLRLSDGSITTAPLSVVH